MRLVTYQVGDGWRSGILVGEAVVDTEAAARQAGTGEDADWTTNRAVIGTDPEQRAAVVQAAQEELETAGMPLSQLRLGPPIPDPEKILCMGLNYRDHAAESGMDLPEKPVFFTKFRNSLIGPEDQIVLPEASNQIDYEAELAVVIGRRARHVEVSEAIGYVAGAMALNDVSARDLQMEVPQWTMGKAIDTFAPCGPALVLMDEIGDLQSLGIRARINGKTLQEANTSLMVFSVAEAIAFLTRVMTLEPGDIIATGTPAGVGWTRNPPVWLRPGDVVEIEIDGIGTIRNPVA